MVDDFYCEALERAYEMETKGKQFYEQALLKAKDPFARKALEFLTAEEERHLDKILRFNSHLFGREEFDLENECRIEISERAKASLEQFVQEKLGKNLEEARTDIEVFRAAMEFEKESYHYYKDQAKKESDSRLKKFFEFLEKEEVKHFELLQETIRYLSEPDYYFEDFGSWIFG